MSRKHVSPIAESHNHEDPFDLKKTFKSFPAGRNLSSSRNDYPYEASGWNLSPIMFQPGTFFASAVPTAGRLSKPGRTTAVSGAWLPEGKVYFGKGIPRKRFWP
jgi:hypothetical protein